MGRKVILASTSPRRKELLHRIVRRFEVVPSTVDESKIKMRSPAAFARQAALAKAQEVSARFPDVVVIGADTIVVLGKKILGKPKNRKEAFAMLQLLRGKTHRVITAISIIDGLRHKKLLWHETTRVKMKRVGDDLIRQYVKSGLPLDKAGAYGIQEIEGDFIEKISGDYNNVVGLPLKKLQITLARFVSSGKKRYNK